MATLPDPIHLPTLSCRLLSDPAGAGGRVAGWKRLLGPYLTWLWRVEVRDTQRLPTTGGVIVVANHLSTLDTLLLGWAISRPAAFLAKAEITEWPIIGPEAMRCGALPARRGKGDPTAYLTALAVLEAGHPVVLHPEGSRSPNGLYGVHRLRSGAARFALARPVPILPVALFGTRAIMPPHRLIPGRGTATAHFGEPIPPETYLPPADWPPEERIKAVNTAIDQGLRALLPPHLQTDQPTPGLEPVPMEIPR